VVKPFGQIHLLIGDPMTFSENDNFNECSSKLKLELDRLEQEAMKRAGI
jgi:lysophospholipid acyltransferase (LPLAT)-like uncharacterized protein